MDEGGNPLKISIQHEDFDLGEETADLHRRSKNAGALVTFTGLVRDLDDSRHVQSLTLEHYPGMTESSLEAIVEEAGQRWPILDATVIHRVGELQAGEQIVLVAVTSLHRQAAFQAAEFMMDFLKTRAPFWKKCRDEHGEAWVEAKDSDRQAERRWDT